MRCSSASPVMRFDHRADVERRVADPVGEVNNDFTDETLRA